MHRTFQARTWASWTLTLGVFPSLKLKTQSSLALSKIFPSHLDVCWKLFYFYRKVRPGSLFNTHTFHQQLNLWVKCFLFGQLLIGTQYNSSGQLLGPRGFLQKALSTRFDTHGSLLNHSNFVIPQIWLSSSCYGPGKQQVLLQTLSQCISFPATFQINGSTANISTNNFNFYVRTWNMPGSSTARSSPLTPSKYYDICIESVMTYYTGRAVVEGISRALVKSLHWDAEPPLPA